MPLKLYPRKRSESRKTIDDTPEKQEIYEFLIDRRAIEPLLSAMLDTLSRNSRELLRARDVIGAKINVLLPTKTWLGAHPDEATEIARALEHLEANFPEIYDELDLTGNTSLKPTRKSIAKLLDILASVDELDEFTLASRAKSIKSRRKVKRRNAHQVVDVANIRVSCKKKPELVEGKYGVSRAMAKVAMRDTRIAQEWNACKTKLRLAIMNAPSALEDMDETTLHNCVVETLEAVTPKYANLLQENTLSREQMVARMLNILRKQFSTCARQSFCATHLGCRTSLEAMAYWADVSRWPMSALRDVFRLEGHVTRRELRTWVLGHYDRHRRKFAGARLRLVARFKIEKS